MMRIAILPTCSAVIILPIALASGDDQPAAFDRRSTMRGFAIRS